MFDKIEKSNDNLKIYLIIANISIIILFYSLWQIKPVLVDVHDFLGLTSHLKMLYWLGLILITICSCLVYINNFDKRHYIFIIFLIYFGIFLFGIPILSEEDAWNSISYYPAGEVKTVMATGHIDTTSEWPLISYRSWPGIHLESAFILNIANVKFENLIKYEPIFWILTVIFLIFSIGRRFKLSTNNSFGAVFIFLASFWLPQYYYGGQSLAIIGFLALFLLTTYKTKYNNALNIIFYIFLTMTHFLTSAIYLLITIIQFRLKNYHKKVAMIFFIVFIAWLVYMAPHAFAYGIKRFIGQATSVDILYWKKTQTFNPVTTERSLINYFRLSYLFLYGVFVAFAYFSYLTNKIDLDAKDKIKKITPWIIGLVPFVFLQYGSEVFERVYMLTLLPAILIIIIGISNKKIILLLMILVVFFHIPAHYGDEITWQTPTVELKGAEFFASSYPYDMLASRGYFIDEDAYYGGVQVAIWYANPNMVQIERKAFPMDKIPKKDINLTAISMLNNVSYVIDDKKMSDDYLFYFGFDPISDWVNTQRYDLIYQNKDFNIMRVSKNIL